MHLRSIVTTASHRSKHSVPKKRRRRQQTMIHRGNSRNKLYLVNVFYIFIFKMHRFGILISKWTVMKYRIPMCLVFTHRIGVPIGNWETSSRDVSILYRYIHIIILFFRLSTCFFDFHSFNNMYRTAGLPYREFRSNVVVHWDVVPDDEDFVHVGMAPKSCGWCFDY